MPYQTALRTPYYMYCILICIYRLGHCACVNSVQLFLYCVGCAKANFYIGLFEQISYPSDQWAVVCKGYPFTSLCCYFLLLLLLCLGLFLFLFFLFFIFLFKSVIILIGKSLSFAIVIIISHSFCFEFSVTGIVVILFM